MDKKKLDQFIAAAKSKGYKDEEISQFVSQQSRAQLTAETPAPEAPKKSFLQGVGEFFNKGLTQAIGMATQAPGLGARAEGTDIAVKERGAKMRELAMQARNEKDPLKKQQLLAESRRLAGEVEGLGQGITQKTEEFKTKFDIKDKDLEKSNLQFAAERGGKAAVDTGIMLAPVSKVFKTAATAGKAAKVAASAINTAATTGIISAVDEATSLEDMTPDERLRRSLEAGMWGAALGSVMGAGGEAFKLLKNKFFADKKVNQQVAMMFTPETSDKLRFENSFGTSFEDEFKARDLPELIKRVGKGELGHKDIAAYMTEKVKEFAGKKKELLTDLTKKTGGANKDDVITALRSVVADWAQNNDLSAEDIGKVENIIKIVEKSDQAIPWEKVDNWRSQLGDMGQAAYKTMGQEQSIFANAEGMVRNMIEEAGKELGNIKALNKGISYYQLAKDSISTKGANELKKVSNDMFQFVTQTLPIMAAGGSIGALAGGEDNRGGGAVIGTAAGTLGAVALGKSLRLNMSTPEGRVKMMNWIKKNAEKLKADPTILNQVKEAIVRSSVVKGAKNLLMGGKPAIAPEIPETPAPTTAPGAEDRTAEQMYDVKDNQTGETIQVPASKLADYGINVPTEEAGGGMSAEAIAQEVVNAAMRGDSKSVTRWSAALEAIKDIQPKEEKMTESQKTAKDAAGMASQALALVSAPGSSIQTGPAGRIEEAKVKFLGKGQQETADFNVMISNLFGTFAKARGGTALTESEKKLLNTYVPAVGDTKQDLVRKLKQIADPNNTALQAALLKGLESQPVLQ